MKELFFAAQCPYGKRAFSTLHEYCSCKPWRIRWQQNKSDKSFEFDKSSIFKKKIGKKPKTVQWMLRNLNKYTVIDWINMNKENKSAVCCRYRKKTFYCIKENNTFKNLFYENKLSLILSDIFSSSFFNWNFSFILVMIPVDDIVGIWPAIRE